MYRELVVVPSLMTSVSFNIMFYKRTCLRVNSFYNQIFENTASRYIFYIFQTTVSSVQVELDEGLSSRRLTAIYVIVMSSTTELTRIRRELVKPITDFNITIITINLLLNPEKVL